MLEPMRVVAVIVVVCALRVVAGAEELWKCEDPVPPVRFAENEEQKENPPGCKKWVKIRGASRQMLEALAGPFSDASDFAREVATAQDAQLPEVSTATLYLSHANWDLEVTDVADAPLGSLALYDGLAGLVVDIQEEDGGVWTRGVLYPSARSEFALRASDPHIPGKMEPIAVVFGGLEADYLTAPAVDY